MRIYDLYTHLDPGDQDMRLKISFRPCLVRIRMKWNHDLNPRGLGMELESWTQLFGEQWNEIRIQFLLFDK